MELTVDLDADIYDVVIALVRAEDYSISEAVNRLPRGSLPAEEGQPKQAIRRTEWHNGYWPRVGQMIPGHGCGTVVPQHAATTQR